LWRIIWYSVVCEMLSKAVGNYVATPICNRLTVHIFNTDLCTPFEKPVGKPRKQRYYRRCISNLFCFITICLVFQGFPAGSAAQPGKHLGTKSGYDSPLAGVKKIRRHDSTDLLNQAPTKVLPPYTYDFCWGAFPKVFLSRACHHRQA
jgi:hypothetical protein